MRAHVNRPQIASLPDLLGLLWRRKWVILPALLVVPAAAFAVSYFQQPRYEARADVLLARGDIGASVTGIYALTPSNETEFAVTQAEVARTAVVAERAVQAAEAPGFSAEELLADSSVWGSTEVDKLVFSVTADTRSLAIRLASAYAEEYAGYREELDAAALEQAEEQLDDRLTSLRLAGQRGSPLYKSLRETLRQVQTLSVLQGTNPTIVRPATKATQVEPSSRRNVLLGFVAGLAIGLGLAFLRELFDKRLRSEDEIIEALDVPLLGRIPDPPRRYRSGARLVTLGEPFGADAEQFRIVHANLEIASRDVEPRSIMITSAVEGERISMLAANLAVTFARAAQSLVLVDLDLRRPTLARYFNLEERPGVTEVALGDVSLDDAIHAVPIGGPDWGGGNGNGNDNNVVLEVLPAGKMGRTLVGTSTLRGILASLEERFGLVFVAAPPLLPAGDALALSTHTDAVLLACHLKVLRRPMLSELRRVLASCPAAKLGFVLLGAELEQSYKLVSVRGKSRPERVI
jgi:Mrp family chromosome partitioning ATPase/capsular polysaccharide biosynthesis protein